MKERPYGFLTDDIISHESEVFDYLQELHEYLWAFVRVYLKSASGNLQDYVDIALKEARYREEDNK